MNRTTLRLLLLGAGAALSAQTAFTAPPAPATWREVPINPMAKETTRMRAETFFVTAAADRLAELEARQDPWGESAEQILAELAQYGLAQQLGFLDHRLALEAENELKATTRLPIALSDRRITFKSCGGSFKLTGSWQERGNRWVAAVSTEFEFTVPVPPESRDNPPDGENKAVPTAITVRLSTEADVPEGQPTVLVGSIAKASGLDRESRPQRSDAIAGLVVVRLTLSREAPQQEEPTEPPPENMPQAGEILFQLEVFSIDGEQKKLAALRDEQLIALVDVPVENVLETLGEIGRAELLSRPNVLVAWPAVASVTVGERVPVPKEPPSGTSSPEVTYQNIGFSLELSGEWLEAVDKDLARVTCRLLTSRLQTDGPNARPRVVKTDRRYEGPAWSARAAWLPSHAAWLPRGDEATLVLVRLTAKRPNPEEPPAASPATSSTDAEPPAQPPRVRVDLWRIEGDRERLASADWERLIGAGPADDAPINLPSGLGRAQRLAHAAGPIDPKEAFATSSGEEPGPSAWEDAKDAAKSAQIPAFAHVGVQGEWSREEPTVARLLVGLKTVNLPRTGRREGSPPAGIREDRIEQRMELRPGGSEWVRSTWWEPGSDDSAQTEPFMVARVTLVADEAASRPAELPQATGANAAGLGASILEFECPVDTFLTTDFAAIGRQSRSVEALLGSLSTLGTARLVRRGWQDVDDLSLGSEAALGERAPLVATPRPVTSGRRDDEVRYVTVGTKAEWCGQWCGDSMGIAVVDVAVSHAGTSQTAALPAIVLPISAQLSAGLSAGLAAGEPSVLICSRGHQPKPDRIVCDVIQLVASRPEARAARSQSAVADAALAGLRTRQAARLRLETFVTELTAEKLAGLARADLERPAEAGELLRNLEKLGPSRLLAGFEGTVLLQGDNRIRQSERVPMTQRTGRVPSVSYVVTGLRLNVGGAWREDAPDRADVRLDLDLSDVISDSSGEEEDSPTPIMGQFETQEQCSVASGRPQLSLATQLIDATPGQERFRLITSRWVVRHTEP